MNCDNFNPSFWLILEKRILVRPYILSNKLWLVFLKLVYLLLFYSISLFLYIFFLYFCKKKKIIATSKAVVADMALNYKQTIYMKSSFAKNDKRHFKKKVFASYDATFKALQVHVLLQKPTSDLVVCEQKPISSF